ncbi:MAG: hypothetical protein EHM28_15075 [Spirochaetaceae bacterium]|nr:MAG: hypothetical protein EHM28_15075 [Spirochaetaceae bacterium]
MESFIDHENAKKDIPQHIQEHLRGLISFCRLPQTDATMERMVEAWLLKKATFQKMAEHGRMQKMNALNKDDKRGCLCLTMSGSLIMIGPLAGGVREIKFTSMGLRTDVPETLVVTDGRLAEDIKCEKPICLVDSKLEKTSAVMDIAVMPEEKTGPEQTAFLRKTDDKLKEHFIRFNRQAVEEKQAGDYISMRDDLFQKWIVIQWFIYGGLDKHVFMARAKILWLELFTRVYDVLSMKKSNAGERDAMFLDFTNNLFAKYCDDYKWYESEHKDFDIGLMKALEEIPEYKAYIDFVDGFCKGL